MGYCKNCIIYNRNYDELQIDYNDIDEQGLHFCPVYENGIKAGVYEGLKDCESFISKEE